MPKNKTNDPITDQEIAFARLILSGTMTDRRAAEAVGINPGSAAYTKAKPHVRAYMREHRAAVQQQLVQQEADGLHRLNLDRDQVLARLWAIANLSPEMTRGSITGQVKALSIIIAMQNFIPNGLEDRLAALTEKNPPTAPAKPQIYVSAWRAAQQAATTALQPGSVLAQQEDPPVVLEPDLIPGSEKGATPDPGSSQPTPAAIPPGPSASQPPPPFVPLLTSVPDARAPFSINRNPFGRRR